MAQAEFSDPLRRSLEEGIDEIIRSEAYGDFFAGPRRTRVPQGKPDTPLFADVRAFLHSLPIESANHLDISPEKVSLNELRREVCDEFVYSFSSIHPITKDVKRDGEKMHSYFPLWKEKVIEMRLGRNDVEEEEFDVIEKLLLRDVSNYIAGVIHRLRFSQFRDEDGEAKEIERWGARLKVVNEAILVETKKTIEKQQQDKDSTS